MSAEHHPSLEDPACSSPSPTIHRPWDREPRYDVPETHYSLIVQIDVLVQECIDQSEESMYVKIQEVHTRLRDALLILAFKRCSRM